MSGRCAEAGNLCRGGLERCCCASCLALPPAPAPFLPASLSSLPPHRPDFHWLPTAEMLGHSPGQVAINLLAVLPVISLSFICQ